MTTTTQPPKQQQPTPPADNTATMGFFRKYRKHILYSAGIFALLSFSISTDMIFSFQNWFREPVKGPTMQFEGRTIMVTEEDERIARGLNSFVESWDYTFVLPPIFDQFEEQQRDILAALRRLAVEAGIGYSEDEVDLALEEAGRILRRVNPEITEANTNDVFAAQAGSMTTFRRLIGEAMRIGTFVRLQALAADVSGASFVESLLKDDEIVTLRVASLDRTKMTEEFEAQEVSDDELLAWVDELEVSERRANNYAELPRVALKLAMVHVEASDGAEVFDPEEWTEELDGVAFSEAELQQFYDVNKFTFYKVEPEPKEEDEDNKEEKEEDGEKPGEEAGKPADEDQGGEAQAGDPGTGDTKPTEDPAQTPDPQTPEQEPETPPAPQFREFAEVKDQIERRLKAEKVLSELWSKLQVKQYEALQELIDARTEALADKAAKKTAHDEAVAKHDEEGTDETQAAVDAAKAALDEAEKAHEAASNAVDEARKDFDFDSAWDELTLDKQGFLLFDLSDGAPPDVRTMFNQEQLRESEVLKSWTMPGVATGIQEAGTMSTQPQHLKGDVFHFIVTDADPAPLKPLDDIREEIKEDWAKAQAEKKFEELEEKFTEELERLAKAAQKDEIAKIEAEKAEEVTKRFDEWKQEQEQRVADLEEQAKGLRAGSIARRDYEATIAKVEEELADLDGRRETIEQEVDEEYQEKIDDALAKAHKDVLDAAAAAANWTVEVLPATSTNLRNKGYQGQHFPPVIKQLFFDSQTAKDLEVGEASEIVKDFAGEHAYLAVCVERRPATIEDITRRQFVTGVERDLVKRYVETSIRSFSIDALEQRYQYTPPEQAGVAGPQ